MNKHVVNAMDAVGPVFQKVGADKQLYLGDFTAKGMCDWGTDFIQLLDPETAVTLTTAVWIDPEQYPDYAGWRSTDWQEDLNDTPISAGQGFLLQCQNCTEDTPIDFAFSGEVQRGVPIVVSNKMALVCNPVPCNLTLGQVTAKGMCDWGTDFIQILDPETAVTTLTAVWIDPEQYPEYGGWRSTDWMEDYNETPLLAGQAFLLQCQNCSEESPIVFEFPDPIADK